MRFNVTNNPWSISVPESTSILTPPSSGLADLQNLIDAVDADGGGIIEFNSRIYNLTGTARVPSGVVLEGTIDPAVRSEPGTVIWNNSALPAFEVTNVSGVDNGRRASIRNMCFYQEHPNPSGTYPTPWAPNLPTRDACIVVDAATDVEIHNILFHGVVAGIRTTGNVGRLDLENIRGQVFSYGIDIEEAYDITRIDKVHFWPFWTSNENVMDYIYDHLDGVVFGRSDGCWMGNVFIFAANNAIRFKVNAFGASTKVYLADAYFDLCRRGVRFEQNNTHLLVGSVNHSGNRANIGATPLPDSCLYSVDAGASGIYVQTANARSRFAQRSPIEVLSTVGDCRFDFGSLAVEDSNQPQTKAPIFYLENATTPNTVHMPMQPKLTDVGDAPLVGPNPTNGLLYAAVVTYEGGSTDGRNEMRFWSALTGGTFPVIGQPIGNEPNIPLRLQAKGTATLTIGFGQRVSIGGPLQLTSYTIASLPPAASEPRALVYLSNGAGNKRLAISDGTVWRYPDGTAV